MFDFLRTLFIVTDAVLGISIQQWLNFCNFISAFLARTESQTYKRKPYSPIDYQPKTEN